MWWFGQFSHCFCWLAWYVFNMTIYYISHILYFKSPSTFKTFFFLSIHRFLQAPKDPCAENVLLALVYGLMSWCRSVAFWGTHRIDTSDFMSRCKTFAEKRFKNRNRGHSFIWRFSQSAFLSGHDRCIASAQSRILIVVFKKRSLCCNLLYFFYLAIKLQKLKVFFLFLQKHFLVLLENKPSQ